MQNFRCGQVNGQGDDTILGLYTPFWPCKNGCRQGGQRTSREIKRRANLAGFQGRCGAKPGVPVQLIMKTAQKSAPATTSSLKNMLFGLRATALLATFENLPRCLTVAPVCQSLIWRPANQLHEVTAGFHGFIRLGQPLPGFDVIRGLAL